MMHCDIICSIIKTNGVESVFTACEYITKIGGRLYMNLELSNILFIISLITMVIYQCSTFSYASSLLIGGIKSNWVFAGLALFNTSAFALVQYIQLDLYLIIIIFLVLLTIEFKLISKTDFVQVFCGASIFVLHITALITPLIVIFSSMYNIPSADLVRDSIYDHIIVIIICVVLSLAHELVKKYINNASIQRVTVKSKHSIILLCSIVILVSFQIYHSATMMSDTIYTEYIILSLAISLASLFTFYLFFLYAINLIDASLYKRYSDKVKGEHQVIAKQKEALLTKIERDELTGLFNRGYIMGELERMCEDGGDPFYVLFIDINALKYTNDTYGHKAGDRLIIKITHAILNNVREYDVVARIGGDEFIVLMPKAQSEDCENIVKRTLQCIERENEKEEFLVSASIGSIYVNDQIKERGVSYILSCADENMRKNKENFYNRRRGDTV